MTVPDTAFQAPLLEPQFLHKLEQLELVSRKIFLGLMKGERKSKKKGQSVEFADYKNYVKGDDLRHLDWNLYARLDRLFIRLFQEEEEKAVNMVTQQFRITLHLMLFVHVTNMPTPMR